MNFVAWKDIWSFLPGRFLVQFCVNLQLGSSNLHDDHVVRNNIFVNFANRQSISYQSLNTIFAFNDNSVRSNIGRQCLLLDDEILLEEESANFQVLNLHCTQKNIVFGDFWV